MNCVNGDKLAIWQGNTLGKAKWMHKAKLQLVGVGRFSVSF